MPAGDFGDPVKLIGTLAPGKALVSLVGSTGQPGATELCTVAAPEWSPFAAEQVDLAVFQRPAALPAERPVAAAVAKAHAAADRAFWAGVGRGGMVILKTNAVVLGFGFLLLFRIAGTARR